MNATPKLERVTEPLSYARLLGAHATLEKPFEFPVCATRSEPCLGAESDDSSFPKEGAA